MNKNNGTTIEAKQQIPMDHTTLEHLARALTVLEDPQEMDAIMSVMASDRGGQEVNKKRERVAGLHYTIIRARHLDTVTRWEALLSAHFERSGTFGTGLVWDWLMEANQTAVQAREETTSHVDGS